MPRLSDTKDGESQRSFLSLLVLRLVTRKCQLAHETVRCMYRLPQ